MATPLPVLSLGWVFLKTGALSFGGLGATLALLERSLVDRLAVLSRAEVIEALTHTKVLPGSTVVQVVAYLGWRLGGWSGSAIAVVAFLLPGAVAMAVFGYGYVHAAVLPGFVAARRGLAAVVIALLLGTMERLANQTLQSPAARALAVLSFVIVLAVPGVLLWVVVGSGLLGMLVYRERPT